MIEEVTVKPHLINGITHFPDGTAARTPNRLRHVKADSDIDAFLRGCKGDISNCPGIGQPES